MPPSHRTITGWPGFLGQRERLSPREQMLFRAAAGTMWNVGAVFRRGKPGIIVSDNGTELTSNAILAWSKDHKVEWHYIASEGQCKTAISRV